MVPIGLRPEYRRAASRLTVRCDADSRSWILAVRVPASIFLLSGAMASRGVVNMSL